MERWCDLGNNNVVKNVQAEETRTRELVARAILENGPATAVELASRLEITPAGVRRHLDALVEDGVLVPREPHVRSLVGRGRGRPAKVFVMTDSGRAQFEHSYDDLAVMAIRFMSAKVDQSMVEGFAKFRSMDLERRAISAISEKSDRTSALAKFLTRDGYAASVHKQGIGHELCQHHCPIAHVAAEFPQMCEAETEAFARVLGTHVQRLATIAGGDGVCTTFIPNPRLIQEKKQKPIRKVRTR